MGARRIPDARNTSDDSEQTPGIDCVTARELLRRTPRDSHEERESLRDRFGRASKSARRSRPTSRSPESARSRRSAASSSRHATSRSPSRRRASCGLLSSGAYRRIDLSADALGDYADLLNVSQLARPSTRGHSTRSGPTSSCWWSTTSRPARRRSSDARLLARCGAPTTSSSTSRRRQHVRGRACSPCFVNPNIQSCSCATASRSGLGRCGDLLARHIGSAG